MTCEQCGAEMVVGSWPFCSGPESHAPAKFAIVGDDIPGGMVVENGFERPITVYSHSEHRRLLAERGCEIRAKWAGPHDKHLSRWDAVSADQLAKATELVSRGAQIAADLPIDVTELPETFRVGVDA